MPPLPEHTELPEKLRFIREKARLSPEAVARAARMRVCEYAKIENGVAEPSLPQLVRISSFFRVSVDYLLGKVNRRPLRQPILPHTGFVDESEIFRCVNQSLVNRGIPPVPEYGDDGLPNWTWEFSPEDIPGSVAFSVVNTDPDSMSEGDWKAYPLSEIARILGAKSCSRVFGGVFIDELVENGEEGREQAMPEEDAAVSSQTEREEPL